MGLKASLATWLRGIVSSSMAPPPPSRGCTGQGAIKRRSGGERAEAAAALAVRSQAAALLSLVASMFIAHAPARCTAPLAPSGPKQRLHCSLPKLSLLRAAVNAMRVSAAIAVRFGCMGNVRWRVEPPILSRLLNSALSLRSDTRECSSTASGPPGAMSSPVLDTTQSLLPQSPALRIDGVREGTRNAVVASNDTPGEPERAERAASRRRGGAVTSA